MRRDANCIVMRFWILLSFIVLGSLGPLEARPPIATQTISESNQQVSTAQAEKSYQIKVATAQPWTDAQVDLQPGDVVQILTASPGAGLDAAGVACDLRPEASASGETPVSSAAPGALIAKLAQNAMPFPVVVSRNISVSEAGHLFLGINGAAHCRGTLAVEVHVGPAMSTVIKDKLARAAQIWASGQFNTGAASGSGRNESDVNGAAKPDAKTATSSLQVSTAPLSPDLRDEIDRLPRRVNDEFNNPGDMVNFVIIGSQQQVESALERANWHLADTSNADAITKAIEMTQQNKDYVQMPMSVLYLFGRAQEFGYEQAEPFAVVASRHHFRLWKAPFEFNHQPVWVGAGTHDIGFEKDQRNGRVTHKIDPAVDQERENIAESLQKSGNVQSFSYYLPRDAVQEAKNATGGAYHSDGRILVISLK